MSGPLAHIRVLDLSRIMAGPWASQILADLGADVIKVERPEGGDDTRSWGPPFLKDKDGKPTRESGYFLSVNRGKRSITIDLASPAGQDIVRKIAAQSDVVLENFKVGTLVRYGLDYDSLKAIKPDIIYCSVTGFGQTGPKREAAAYDFMIQGMGGLMSVTGERDDEPGGGPQKVGVPIVDLMTGMYATVGILAALARRAVSGSGEFVDIAMLDVQTAVLANQAMNYLISGREPRRTGNRHPNIQPQDVFKCSDGHLVLAVGNDTQFQRLAVVIGHPNLAYDPRYATNKARIANLPALLALLRESFAQKPLNEWLALLEREGIPSGPINTIPMVFEEPQVKHRELLRHLPHPLAGTVPQVTSPIRLSNAPLNFDRPPPLLGQHTDEVMRELGLAPLA